MPNLLIAEMPYPVAEKSPVSAGNRNCAQCQAKADYTCVEGEQHIALCLEHAETWALAHQLKMPAQRKGAAG